MLFRPEPIVLGGGVILVEGGRVGEAGFMSFETGSGGGGELGGQALTEGFPPIALEVAAIDGGTGGGGTTDGRLPALFAIAGTTPPPALLG
jgi:hypothetical protein